MSPPHHNLLRWTIFHSASFSIFLFSAFSSQNLWTCYIPSNVILQLSICTLVFVQQLSLKYIDIHNKWCAVVTFQFCISDKKQLVTPSNFPFQTTECSFSALRLCKFVEGANRCILPSPTLLHTTFLLSRDEWLFRVHSSYPMPWCVLKL